MAALYVILTLLALALLWGLLTFNRIIRLTNMRSEAWSGIDVQLKRRHDLIPNLVETVKGYAAHERGLLEDIARLRAQSASAGSIAEKGRAEEALTTSIKTLFAVAEAYPDLKANTNFLRLQQDLTAVEDELQLARRYYNGTVREYNTAILSFPNLVIAALMAMRPAEFFSADTTERATPGMKLS